VNRDLKPDRHLALLTRVRCLECGGAYAKPAGGGTVTQNPGCPRCGYLGWIPFGIDVSAVAGTASLRSRSGEDPRRRRSSRPH
jgi:hypothetical protein